jgi:hypothetical protein
MSDVNSRYNDWEAKHKIRVDEKLRTAGFNVEALTQDQKDLIMQPDEAPENFYMDNEITPRQAFAFWKMKLHDSGLSPKDVQRAVKIHF